MIFTGAAICEQKGWNQIGFDDSHWRPVVIQEAPKGILRPQMAAPVKIMERYDIQKVTKLNADQVASASVSTREQSILLLLCWIWDRIWLAFRK